MTMEQPVEQPKVSRTRTALDHALTDLEDAYKLTFLGVDRIVYHAAASGNKDEVFQFTYSGAGPTWAAPITYGRACEVAKICYSHMVSSTYLATTALIESYLSTVCLSIMKVLPFDSTWFVFDRLNELSNITDVSEIARYKPVETMFKFRELLKAAEFGTAAPVVAHETVLGCFEACRKFAEDFEYAFMLANPNVKEGAL